MAIRTLITAALVAATAVPAAAAERSFPVTGFDRVSAGGSENITIVTGSATSVVATGDTDKLDRLDIRVDGTTLRIGHKPGNWSSWGPDRTHIKVTLPALHGISLSGSGNASADRGVGPDFAAKLSGSGDISIAQLDSAKVSFATSGSGDISAAGKCGDVAASISGSGDMRLGKLECANIDVRISGSGDVAAHATQLASIRVSGSGDVTVTGGARCQSHTSGSGSVTCG